MTDKIGIKQEDDVVMATLPLNELLELMEDSRFLEVLYSNGVADWEWFDDALKEYNDEVKDESPPLN